MLLNVSTRYSCSSLRGLLNDWGGGYSFLGVESIGGRGGGAVVSALELKLKLG